MVGVALALVTQVAAIFMTARRDSTFREVLVILVFAVAAILATVWIGSLWHQHVSSWGCG
jgi:hypothetical protein